jgi:hypothetical protein
MASNDFSDYSDSDSDSDNEWDLMDQREVEYEQMEQAMESWPLPPCLLFLTNVSIVDLRECLVSSQRWSLAEVLSPASVYSWLNYRRGSHEFCPRSRFQYADWDTIGEYCCMLCLKCAVPFSWHVVLRVLKYGRFVNRPPRATLPIRFNTESCRWNNPLFEE